MAFSTGRICRNALLAGLLALSSAAVLRAAPAPVTFTTADGLTLAAAYSPPAPGKGVLVMLHGLDSVKEEWRPFSDVAEAAGWGTFAYDARGHGKSVRGAQKGFRSWGPGGPGTPWDRMPDDLASAVRYLASKGVPTSSITVIGASLGANVAVRYAARGERLHALVLMSPGLNYIEFRPDGDLPSVRVRTLIIVSPADRYAFASSNKLKSLTPDVSLWTDVPEGHGVQMFDVERKLSNRLLEWIAK